MKIRLLCVPRFLEGLDDDIMRREMEPAMSALVASGRHVLLAAQKLSIQPSQAEHKEEFVMSIQNVFLGVVKVIQLVESLRKNSQVTLSDFPENIHCCSYTKLMKVSIMHYI